MTIDSAYYKKPVPDQVTEDNTAKSNSNEDSATEREIADRNLWRAAIKLPMYSVAIMPIILGSAIAFPQTNTINFPIFFTFLIAAILILIWENLSNDVFDSETGIDRNKHHSVVNLTGNKSLVFWIGHLCLLVGILGIIAIALFQQDFTILGIILLCCALGYAYQGPPFRLGYQGLGEILCFFAFGPLAVSAAYYSQTQTWSVTAVIASMILGITTTLVLFCSHFHQVEDDLAAGKRSPIVRLGTHRGAQLLTTATIFLFTIALIGTLLGRFPLWTLLIGASIPSALKLTRHVNTYHDQPDRISNSKFLAINLQFWSSILFSLGFLIEGIF